MLDVKVLVPLHLPNAYVLGEGDEAGRSDQRVGGAFVGKIEVSTERAGDLVKPPGRIFLALEVAQGPVLILDGDHRRPKLRRLVPDDAQVLRRALSRRLYLALLWKIHRLSELTGLGVVNAGSLFLCSRGCKK